MAFVVVGHRPSSALLHRQTGLGAVERLDLALLINREDDGVGGRIDIETDDVPELLDKLRVLRQFERPDTVRRELVSFQDALHRTQAHSGRLGKFPARPVGGLARRRPQGQIDHPLNGVGRQRGLARLARLVAQQSFDALRHEPRLPGPHHRLRFTGPAHDLGSAAAVGGGKDNLGAPQVLLWRATIRNDRLKPEAICSRDVDDNSCSHNESLDCFGRFGDLGIVRMNQTTSRARYRHDLRGRTTSVAHTPRCCSHQCPSRGDVFASARHLDDQLCDDSAFDPESHLALVVSAQ